MAKEILFHTGNGWNFKVKYTRKKTVVTRYWTNGWQNTHPEEATAWGQHPFQDKNDAERFFHHFWNLPKQYLGMESEDYLHKYRQISGVKSAHKTL